MRITHPGCEAVWSGLNIEHCPACHQTFASTEARDAHRVGLHGVTEGPDRRRCLTVEEMLAKVNSNGDPWYELAPNTYGTLVWSRNRPDLAPRGHWDVGDRVTDGVGSTPEGSGLPLAPGREFEAVPA